MQTAIFCSVLGFCTERSTQEDYRKPLTGNEEEHYDGGCGDIHSGGSCKCVGVLLVHATPVTQV